MSRKLQTGRKKSNESTVFCQALKFIILAITSTLQSLHFGVCLNFESNPKKCCPARVSIKFEIGSQFEKSR